MGGDEPATCSPRAIRKDFMALGWLIRESGAQVIFSSFLQLRAATLEETDEPNLLIRGSVAGVTATILGFSAMRWPTQHQAFRHQMGFTFLKGERGSLLRNLWGSLAGL